MGQTLIVALFVVLAAGYAVWRGMPQRWRRALAECVARASRRLGASPAQSERVAASLSRASGCGHCDSCGSCGPQPSGSEAASAGSRVQTGKVHPPTPRRPLD